MLRNRLLFAGALVTACAVGLGSKALAEPQTQQPGQQSSQEERQKQQAQKQRVQPRQGMQQSQQQPGAEARFEERAAQQFKKETTAEARQRMNQPRQVQGTIIETKSVDVEGEPVKNTVALIRTEKGNRRLVVDLGPEADLKDVNLTRGMKIAAEGPVVRLRDHQVLVASKLKIDGKERSVERMEQRRQLDREVQARR